MKHKTRQLLWKKKKKLNKCTHTNSVMKVPQSRKVNRNINNYFTFHENIILFEQKPIFNTYSVVWMLWIYSNVRDKHIDNNNNNKKNVCFLLWFNFCALHSKTKQWSNWNSHYFRVVLCTHLMSILCCVKFG